MEKSIIMGKQMVKVIRTIDLVNRTKMTQGYTRKSLGLGGKKWTLVVGVVLELYMLLKYN